MVDREWFLRRKVSIKRRMGWGRHGKERTCPPKISFELDDLHMIIDLEVGA